MIKGFLLFVSKFYSVIHITIVCIKLNEATNLDYDLGALIARKHCHIQPLHRLKKKIRIS